MTFGSSTTNSSIDGPLIGDPSSWVAIGTVIVARPAPGGAVTSQPHQAIV